MAEEHRTERAASSSVAPRSPQRARRRRDSSALAPRRASHPRSAVTDATLARTAKRTASVVGLVAEDGEDLTSPNRGRAGLRAMSMLLWRSDAAVRDLARVFL